MTDELIEAALNELDFTGRATRKSDARTALMRAVAIAKNSDGALDGGELAAALDRNTTMNRARKLRRALRDWPRRSAEARAKQALSGKNSLSAQQLHAWLGFEVEYGEEPVRSALSTAEGRALLVSRLDREVLSGFSMPARSPGRVPTAGFLDNVARFLDVWDQHSPLSLRSKWRSVACENYFAACTEAAYGRPVSTRRALEEIKRLLGTQESLALAKATSPDYPSQDVLEQCCRELGIASGATVWIVVRLTKLQMHQSGAPDSPEFLRQRLARLAAFLPLYESHDSLPTPSTTFDRLTRLIEACDRAIARRRAVEPQSLPTLGEPSSDAAAILRYKAAETIERAHIQLAVCDGRADRLLMASLGKPHDLRSIAISAADSVSARVHRGRGGARNKERWAAKQAVAALAVTYWECTGKKPVISGRWVTGERYGSFLNLMKIVLPSLGIGRATDEAYRLLWRSVQRDVFAKVAPWATAL
ncbi:MAG: hypothetical protein FJX57_02560 [Alphaproteobacteria bacterium]|nr:hypothetical protein [Alphaproteobacteria bacterium]